MDKVLSDQLIKWAEKEEKLYAPVSIAFSIRYSKIGWNKGKEKWLVKIDDPESQSPFFSTGETPQEAYLRTIHMLMGTDPPPF